MSEADTSPVAGPATGVPDEEGEEVVDVHGQPVRVRRDPDLPNDAELIREKLHDQRVVVTPSGEYSLDEAGELVFVPYPDLGPPRG